jgi:hypothetical protein
MDMNFRCATDVAKKVYAPPWPLTKVIDRATSAMSASNAEPCDDFVQVVNSLIDGLLIDGAVKEIQAGSSMATYDIYTEMEWTPACEKLLDIYRTEVHPKVYPASNDQYHYADAILRSSFNRR